jgi:hypothetical protein
MHGVSGQSVRTETNAAQHMMDKAETVIDSKCDISSSETYRIVFHGSVKITRDERMIMYRIFERIGKVAVLAK